MIFVKQKSIFLLILFSIFSFSIITGCSAELNITSNDNSIEINFNGKSGQAFEKMIQAATGLDSSNTVLFDSNEIRAALEKAGFSKIQINEQRGANLNISFLISDKNSFVFTSGLITQNNGNVQVNLNPITLKLFYDKAPSQITDLLDLMLSPVFNDEKMSEEEYIETISSFYGQESGLELQESEIKITLTGKDKKKQLQKIKLSKLLCGI